MSSVLSELVTPGVVAAAVSGGTSYVIGRSAARAAIAGAEIGADVEREKLAHERMVWRAERWAGAAGKIVELSKRMELVARQGMAHELRDEAAAAGATLLVEVMVLLRDEPGAHREAGALLASLDARDFDGASEIWARFRERILAGTIA